MHNPCGLATRCYEEESEEVLAGGRATRGWVPPALKVAPCSKHPSPLGSSWTFTEQMRAWGSYSLSLPFK